MGCFGAVAEKFSARKSAKRVLFLGLDNSGKTAILHYIDARHKDTGGKPAPTIGFQTHEVEYNNMKIMATDMAGTARYRSLWEKCYGENDGIVFVIDASDKLRHCVVKVRNARPLFFFFFFSLLSFVCLFFPPCRLEFIASGSHGFPCLKNQDEVENLIESVAASGLPIVFLLTKMSFCGGMTKDSIVRALGLDNIKDRPWNVFEGSIRQGA